MDQPRDETLSNLTWDDIQDWAGSTIASRGRSYQRGHRVQELARTPDGGIVAWVKGTARYATMVTIESGDLTAFCTCPYEGVCKHAVAVLLEYLERLEKNVAVPAIAEGDQRVALLNEDVADETWLGEGVEQEEIGTATDSLHSYLEEQSKAELIRLLESLSQRYPAVHDALRDRYHLLKGDAATLVKALRKEIEELGAGFEPDWRGEWNVVEPDYSAMRDRLEMLLEKGHADEVVELGKRLLAAGKRHVETVDDEGESIQEIASCMDIVFKALSKSSLSPADRMLWAVEAKLEDEYEFCSGADAFWERQHAAADWSTLADRLLQRLNESGAPEGEDEYSSRYRRDRLSDWVITALVNAGRRDEVIPLCEQEAERTKSYVRLVSYLIKEDRRQEAERWIRRGIKDSRASLPGIAGELHDILRQMRKQEGDWIGVTALVADDFFAMPSAEQFRKLQASAEQAGVWSAVRPAAMRFLKTGELPDNSKEKETPNGTIPRWPLPETGVGRATAKVNKDFPLIGTLIDIAIAEKRPDEVVRWYDMAVTRRSRHWMGLQDDRISQAIAGGYPDRAVSIWKKLAEDCIARTQPRAYEEAAGYLLCVRNTLQTGGRGEEWRRYFTELRQKNARKKRLVEILDSMVTDETRQELVTIYGENASEQDDVDIEPLLARLGIHDWQKKLLRDADRIERDCGGRYISIPKAGSDEAYRDMEDFISTVENERLQDRLTQAIQQRHPFRRFKDVLEYYPEERERWFSFNNSRIRERVLEWLKDEGIESV
ncbi:MAG: SWIM zinc finger family protein [Chloroflexi bacterium]|nr:SWIM zinc finger family protein [Chloroflexota bacterium]